MCPGAHGTCAKHRRHRQQRAAFFCANLLKQRKGFGQLRRVGQAANVAPQRLERCAHVVDIQRWQIHRVGHGARRAFQRRKQIIYTLDVGIGGQRAPGFQLADQRLQIHPRPAGQIGGGGEQPQRRPANHQKAGGLERIADGFAHHQLAARHTIGRKHAFDAADKFDDHPQQPRHRGLVQVRLPHPGWQQQLGYFVDQPAAKRRTDAQGALGQRQCVLRRPVG